MVSKEMRQSWDAACGKSRSGNPHGDLVEAQGCLEQCMDALDIAEKRIAELERENARLHELYALDRDEHQSRGGA